MDKHNKVMFVASPGGHFIQMSLLAQYFSPRIVVSTYEECPLVLSDSCYYRIKDISRDSLFPIFSVIISAITIIKSSKPDLVVTTGAAPGLVFVVLAKFIGIKSIWIDSLANSKKLSLSGKIATYFGIDVFTQWPDLNNGKSIKYRGRVL